ncbi:transmembrane protein 246 isoform X2 [Gadus chalcogrammus]|uniref:transmembrane protein 246 isoform X2 n=1 Tax=Gadus chalcogrammus TaxID=1042646 RepID=UPI0024C3E00A|nr:transmembrane protein 246 isoform X2 [Gadus chalcogrammus]
MECLRRVRRRWPRPVAKDLLLRVRTRPAGQALLLCVLTFGVLLPLLCQRMLYSYYFFRPWYLEPRSETALQESYRRGQGALSFWQKDTGAHAVQTQLEPHLLVTVVTARRTEARDYHYLLQVMQQLAGLLGSCSGERCAQVLLCDVESDPEANEDLALLEGRFQTGWELLRPQNVVVLEDDAWPRPDFFPVIQDLLSRSFSSGTLYVKLYHPERLQRYWNPEPYRLLEWLGLGLLASSLLLLVLPYCSSVSFTLRHLLFFSVYTMALAELVGRHYLLELRRASPQLYAVSPATECCTPAMLYPGNASLRAARYLDGSFCVKGLAKDLVLFRMARSVPGERAHSLEPNLVAHIGAFSSVRPNPLRPSLL